MLGNEKVQRVLKEIGLTEKETDIYIFLAKHGVQRSGQIAKGIRTHRAEVYRALKSLQSKGLVQSTLEAPARFITVPFESVIDSFIKTKREEATFVESAKPGLLQDWEAISKKVSEPRLEKFAVIEGRQKIYSRILQMVNQTKNQLSTSSSVQGLVRAYRFGILDAAFSHPLRSKVKFRFLTEFGEDNLEKIEVVFGRIPKDVVNLQGRTPELGLKLCPQMVIRDEEEVILFARSPSDLTISEKEDTCIWTDCRSLVLTFSAIFEESWCKATDIQEKIVEIKKGNLVLKHNRGSLNVKDVDRNYQDSLVREREGIDISTSSERLMELPVGDLAKGESTKTCVLEDTEVANKKYYEAIQTARKEIFILTSSSGLKEFLKDEELIQNWVQRDINVKIMAPITIDNLETANQLGRTCEVKHVPVGYVETTIVDGSSLFQFKTNPLDRTKVAGSLQTIIYSNDCDYIRKTENMLNYIWRISKSPTPIGLTTLIQGQSSSVNKSSNLFNEYKRIVGFDWGIEPQLGGVTEKEVIDEIRFAKKVSAKNPLVDSFRVYGTMACGIIYPPESLNMPNFIVQAFKGLPQSTFGAEDFLLIYVQMKIADQYSYLPVAFVTNNIEGYKFRKGMQEGHPTTEKAMLVNEGQLEVRVQPNSLFVGWTLPIPLLAPKHVLPPSCILFEGYGNIKSYSSEFIGLAGRKSACRFNSLEAFVTLINPSSNYSGPGSDGLFHREMVITSHPLQR